MPLSAKVACWLAGLQALTIIGLEVATLVTVLRYVENVFSSWSSDKSVAIYFMLLVIAALYGVFLLVGGVLNGDTIQIIGFCVFNLFTMSLAIFRYFQVQSWLRSDERAVVVAASEYVLNIIRPEMVASMAVTGGMTVAFGVLTYFMYHSFGWEIYKRVGADLKVRRMFINYRVLVLLLKLNFFMFVGFAVSYIILILKSSDPEFAITVALVPLTLAVLYLAFWSLRRESLWMMWTVVALLCASSAYFVFKVARMYDPKQEEKYATQRPMMTYYTIVSLVVVAATLRQAAACMAGFGYGLKERVEITRGKRSDMEQIQDYYVNAAGDRRMNLDG
ncbi:hypothetical protein H4R21_005073 [Coemansia helicoidea]|uniref:Uncharacterized protein n=1 Tax=Coemansia helicoidea TaxID=1286919 RepID=A0ACC1KUY6_9FUNG|nr:hypothetical protein H4R21_005073 [Coemansia helicoidea]